MTRITPRTCLWPLAGSLVVTFSLSIGLTFRSNHHCFAGTCGEWLFPLQARLHVVVWYAWLTISITVLAVRALDLSIQRTFRLSLIDHKILVVKKGLSVGGCLLFLWIISLYGIIVGIWWTRLHDYFTQRGVEGGISSGNWKLAAIALTGHLCDVTMGMALLPVSRHSALASFFKVSIATALTFHMTTTYVLFILVIVHGLLYVSWVPGFDALPQGLKRVFPVLNPTYLYNEVWPGSTSSLGLWRASLIFTGSLVAIIFLLIFITTLPTIRSRHFNVFYFTHLLGILAIIIICLHASTMLYSVAPGLAMYVLDWSMRIYELWRPLDGELKTLGRGWYLLKAPLSRRRLDGCACTSPLAHFYIYHSGSSMLELHPFTTTTPLASQNAITDPTERDISIQFLFRPQNSTSAFLQSWQNFESSLRFLRRLRRQTRHSEWTSRLAGFANEEAAADIELPPNMADDVNTTENPIKSGALSLHLEGPYFTAADPRRFHNVICIVAGTGISGALAIAGMFKELGGQTVDMRNTHPLDAPNQASKSIASGGLETVPAGSGNGFNTSLSQQRIWTRCIVLWSVKEEHYIPIPNMIEGFSSPTIGLSFEPHLTGTGRKRLCVGDSLDEVLDSSDMENNDRKGLGGVAGPRKTWIYISGPNAFITAGEDACKKRVGRGVEWCSARYDI